MKPFALASLAAAAIAGLGATMAGDTGTPRYDGASRLIAPPDYREWVFLSSGIDMSYSETPAMAGAHMFDNVFAPRAAYAAFLKSGVWPDKTVLMLENRGGASKGSINRLGVFQTGEVMGLEAHVKDTARFKGGWAFFGFAGDAPARQIPYGASCYSCHQAHAAADTTFVQFYPTLLPVATKLRTLNPAYVAEAASGGSR
ncbi:MAG TPA: cytochrome P460 family protein [Caulobacteraceae bacterium]|nr:cytochrome P460 family protein [Caulobacteraceae bacterium]